MTDSRPLINVACGVLQDAGRRILIARRPEGKIAAGQWEFPGGKIEADETARQALRRELQEELGVRMGDAEPLVVLMQDYADRRVRLDCWRVSAFDGTPIPREGQQLAWIEPSGLAQFDVLPSCWPVRAALQLPRVYVMTPPTAPLTDWLQRLPYLPAGSLLRLRRPELAASAYAQEAGRLLETCAGHGLQLILDREPALAESLGAAGWHADSSALGKLEQRPLPRRYWCLASVHDAAELHRARACDMDAAVLSPVLPTGSHPGNPVLGWDGFAALVVDAGLPVYAMGGLGRGDLLQARNRGAFGVAGISAYWSLSSGG